MPFPTQPMMQASPVQGSALRTHTHGDLGYRHPVMPAQLAPVNNPSGVQVAHQDQFQPLLYPVKGQIPEYYRDPVDPSVCHSRSSLDSLVTVPLVSSQSLGA